MPILNTVEGNEAAGRPNQRNMQYFICRIKPAVKSGHSLEVFYHMRGRVKAPTNFRYANGFPSHTLKAAGSICCTAHEACAPEMQRLCCSTIAVHCRSQMTRHCISKMLRTALTNRKVHTQQQLSCQPRRMLAGMSSPAGTSKMSLLTVQSQQAGRRVLPRKALQKDVLLTLQGKGRLHKEQATPMTCS